MSTPVGRKPFYEAVTPEQIQRAVERLRLGAPRNTVIQAEFGCSDAAVHRFLREGERVADFLDADPTWVPAPRERMAADLWMAVNKAWNEAELKLLDEIRRAERVIVEHADGKTTRRSVLWQARAWILERSRPERYALKGRAEPESLPQSTGPAPGSPEHEAALLAALVAKPELLAKANALAKQKAK